MEAEHVLLASALLPCNHAPMEYRFTKMHGLGNDFVVIDAIHQSVHLTPEQIRFLADRHRGIGCDQLLLVEASTLDNVDFKYRIYNQDGGEVEQCGNGARCFARYVVDNGFTDKSEIAVETLAGVIQLHLESDRQVTVNMGVPRFKPAEIPLDVADEAARYTMQVAGKTLEFGAVSMGNPHAVIAVEDVDRAPVLEWGPEIENHKLFPQRVNAGFMQKVSNDRIKLRVFERGVGETLACGSGACAAVVIANHWGWVGDSVRVDLPGGQLLIRWQGDDNPVYMTGPAESVFEGSVAV